MLTAQQAHRLRGAVAGARLRGGAALRAGLRHTRGQHGGPAVRARQHRCARGRAQGHEGLLSAVEGSGC